VMVSDGLGALPAGAAVAAQDLAELVAAALVLPPSAGAGAQHVSRPASSP
jgi:hypothetical protein